LDARDLPVTSGFELNLEFRFGLAFGFGDGEIDHEAEGVGQLPCRDGVEYGQIRVRERENGRGQLVLPSWSSLFSAPGTGKNFRGTCLHLAGQKASWSGEADLPEERPVVLEQVLLDDPAVAPLRGGGVQHVDAGRV
jgi:hypothetical protein